MQVLVFNSHTGEVVEGRRFLEMIEQEKCPHCSEPLKEETPGILSCRFCGPIKHKGEKMTDREIINEALSEYVENLRSDDDSFNNFLADRAEEIQFVTKQELDFVLSF